MGKLARSLPLLTLLALALFAFAQDETQPQTQAAPASDQLDERFVPVAADADLYEIRSSQLVLEQAADDQEVAALAQRIIDDHTASSARLAEIAGALVVALPQEPSAETQAKLDQLQSLSGAELVAAYLEQQEQAHFDAIALYTAQAETGQNEELRAFAQETLPALQQHLEMVQSLRTARDAQAGGAG